MYLHEYFCMRVSAFAYFCACIHRCIVLRVCIYASVRMCVIAGVLVRAYVCLCLCVRVCVFVSCFIHMFDTIYTEVQQHSFKRVAYAFSLIHACCIRIYTRVAYALTHSRVLHTHSHAFKLVNWPIQMCDMITCT